MPGPFPWQQAPMMPGGHPTGGQTPPSPFVASGGGQSGGSGWGGRSWGGSGGGSWATNPRMWRGAGVPNPTDIGRPGNPGAAMFQPLGAPGNPNSASNQPGGGSPPPGAPLSSTPPPSPISADGNMTGTPAGGGMPWQSQPGSDYSQLGRVPMPLGRIMPSGYGMPSPFVAPAGNPGDVTQPVGYAPGYTPPAPKAPTPSTAPPTQLSTM